MTGGGHTGREQPATARCGRTMLYTVGGALVVGAMLLDLLPSLANLHSPLRVRVGALAGALFLAMGRFGSMRFLARLGAWSGRPR